LCLREFTKSHSEVLASWIWTDEIFSIDCHVDVFVFDWAKGR
jgi:hypothetical protein